MKADPTVVPHAPSLRRPERPDPGTTTWSPLQTLRSSVRRDPTYTAVAGSQRFRALQRRRTRAASLAGFLVVAGSVAVDAVVLLGIDGPTLNAAVVLDLLILVAALVARSLLQGALRRRPEVTAFVIMIGVTAATALSGALEPTVAAQAIAYLLILPTVLAMFLPWRTSTHLLWLAAYALLVATYLILGPDARFDTDERGDLAVVFLIATAAAIVGHDLLQRTQVQNFIQMERIRALGRKNAESHRELERIYRELERTARIDPLTGAGNRRRLEEDLAAIRSTIDRTGAVYGLIEIDLDHFKSINDRLGHLAGDDVLKRVVVAVQGTIRAEDAIYRYGGEEFVAIVAVPDQDRLRVVAERVRRTVEALRIEHPALTGAVVTVSVGATLIDAQALAHSDEAWFRVVDDAMYAAKAGGRNQVRLVRVAAS